MTAEVVEDLRSRLIEFLHIITLTQLAKCFSKVDIFQKNVILRPVFHGVFFDRV